MNTFMYDFGTALSLDPVYMYATSIISIYLKAIECIFTKQNSSPGTAV